MSSQGAQVCLGDTVPTLWLTSLVTIHQARPDLPFSMLQTSSFLSTHYSPLPCHSDGYGVCFLLREVLCFVFQKAPSFFVAVQSALAWPARAVQMTF